MPIAPDFPARSPGEVRTFSLDLTSDLSSGDYIVSVQSSIFVSSGEDNRASTLIASSPQILLNTSGINAVVAQRLGTNTNNPVGFKPNVTYTWSIVATTQNNEILKWTVNIPILGM